MVPQQHPVLKSLDRGLKEVGLIKQGKQKTTHQKDFLDGCKVEEILNFAGQNCGDAFGSSEYLWAAYTGSVKKAEYRYPSKRV